MKKYVVVCVFCGNETTDSYCHECNEYKGLVEGYYNKEGEFIPEEEK